MSSSKSVYPRPSVSFIYKLRGWIVRISSHLLFLPKSCYLLALWFFQREIFLRSLQVETSFFFLFLCITLSVTSRLFYFSFHCCFSCCPWLCRPFLLTRSPGHSAVYCNVNLRENWLPRVVNPDVESEQINNTSWERYLRNLPLR